MSVICLRHRRISTLLPIISVMVCLLTAAPPASATIAGHKYTYDYRNRLIEVKERQSASWNTTAEYKYDAQNRRILKIVTNLGDLNGTTRYIWGGKTDWQCLEERDGDDDLVARYTYAPGYIDDVAVQERDLNADDDFADDDEVVYYMSNTLHNVCGLVDADENVLERYRYDAYGACAVLDADGSADSDGLSDVENPYTYTGRHLDLESDLIQYRNRYQSPTLGRFISRDPIGYAGGINLYAYVGSRPMDTVDPLGLDYITRTVLGVYFVRQNFWGIDQEHVFIGTVDSADIVHFSGMFSALDDMPLSAVMEVDGRWSIDTAEELLTAIQGEEERLRRQRVAACKAVCDLMLALEGG
jgi:RHS repeat-associated protein